MLCALTNSYPSDTVWVTFLSKPRGPKLYLHTSPELDHRASNITLDDIDYATVANEFGILVNRGNFADRALSRWSWSGGLELKTVVELDENDSDSDSDEEGDEDGEAAVEEEELVDEVEEEGSVHDDDVGSRSRRDSLLDGSEMGISDVTSVNSSVGPKSRRDSLFDCVSDEEMGIDGMNTETLETEATDINDETKHAEENSSDDENLSTMTLEEASQIQADSFSAHNISRQDHARLMKSFELYGQISKSALLERYN
jgi:hypothetical protein